MLLVVTANMCGADTFPFQMLKATCGIPEIAFATFENMQYGEGFVFIVFFGTSVYI